MAPEENDWPSKDIFTSDGFELPGDPVEYFSLPPGFTIHKFEAADPELSRPTFDGAPPGFTVHKFRKPDEPAPEVVIESESYSKLEAANEDPFGSSAASGPTSVELKPPAMNGAAVAVAARTKTMTRAFYKEQAKHLGDRAKKALPAMVLRVADVTLPALSKLTGTKSNESIETHNARVLESVAGINISEIKRQRGLVCAVGALALLAAVIHFGFSGHKKTPVIRNCTYSNRS